MRMQLALVLSFGALCGHQARAAGGAAPFVPAAAVAQVAPAKSVDSLVTRLEGEMTRVATKMPANKYGFTPASLDIAGSNFVKVRTFGEQLTHMAQANYSIAANIMGTEPQVDLKAIGALKSKDEILAALAASFAAVHKAIATITPANENEFIDDSGVGPDQTKMSEAAWVAVHGYDHYGQMVEYLRMNGITP